jgi:hypothetical protein
LGGARVARPESPASPGSIRRETSIAPRKPGGDQWSAK